MYSDNVWIVRLMRVHHSGGYRETALQLSQLILHSFPGPTFNIWLFLPESRCFVHEVILRRRVKTSSRLPRMVEWEHHGWI